MTIYIMNRSLNFVLILIFVGVGLAASVKSIDFLSDLVNSKLLSVVPLIGHWHVIKDGENAVLSVNGMEWQQGQALENLNQSASRLFPDAQDKFQSSVRSYAFFPLAVLPDISDFQEGEVRIRFKPVSGRKDQSAGIAFNLRSDGSYLILRANAKENSVVLFKFSGGKRSSIEWAKKTLIDQSKWNELKLVVNGQFIEGHLNGNVVLHSQLNKPVEGRIGLWSENDSVVYIDDVSVNIYSDQ